MSSTKTLDRIRQLRQDAIDAKREIENQIHETKSRINEVCRRGVLPFDEAFSTWKAAFESYADDGKARLEKSFSEYASPNDPDPTTDRTATRFDASYELQTRTNASGVIRDNGAVFAHLHRETIIEQARAWFEERCKECNVPPANERADELQRLASQLKDLEDEQADIEDELAELFNTDPSERTQRAQKEAEREGHLDSFNEPVRKRNAAMPEQKPSPITVKDADGRDVDDPEHGPAVRSA